MKHQKWSCNEVKFLREKYGKFTAKTIAQKLERTVNSVQNEIQRLGIRKEDFWEKWRKEHKLPELTRETLYKLYWEEKMPTTQIADLYDVSKQTILYQMSKYNIRRRSNSEAHIKHVNFDKKVIAYILGVLSGDGWMGSQDRICLKNKSRHFAVSFMNALKQIGLNPCMYPIEEPPTKLVNKPFKGDKVEASSKEFANWYSTLTLTEIEDSLNTDYLKKAFIRGFYESEGSNFVEYPHVWGVSMGNTNKELIKLVEKLLRGLGFKFYLGESEGLYSLRCRQRETVKRFIEEINPCIKREMVRY